MMMDQGEYDADPFSSDSLWRLSNFTLEFLQPSDLFQWNENLPGTFYTGALKAKHGQLTASP